LLLASAVSLSIGGALLYAFDLVQVQLIELTAVAVVVLLFLAIYVRRGKLWAINIGTALGIIAPLFSLSTPAHVAVLTSIGQAGALLSLLGILQLLGFFIFPLTYVILRIAYRNGIATKPATIVSESQSKDGPET
jgi:hypothetical protein